MSEKTVYLFLAPGFEETEAITPLDILKRAGLTVYTVAVGENLLVTSTHGVILKADKLLEDIKDIPQAVVLPGGMPGADNLDIPEVHKIICSCYKSGGIVAAICAAPKILGGIGLLEGKNAVCYPGFERYLTGAIQKKDPVVQDGQIITAIGMGAATAFGLKLAECLAGFEKSKNIAGGIFYSPI